MTNKELAAQVQQLRQALATLEVVVARESGMAFAYRCVLHSLFRLGLNRAQLVNLLQDTLADGRTKLNALEYVNQHAAAEFDLATESILAQAMGQSAELPQSQQVH